MEGLKSIPSTPVCHSPPPPPAEHNSAFSLSRHLRHRLLNRKDGAFALLSAETLEVLYEGRDARHWLHDAKFSPAGDTFAVASHDQKIYLYDSRQVL